MISKMCHHWAKSSAKGREQGGHGTSARSRRPCSHLRDVHLLTLLGEVVRRLVRGRGGGSVEEEENLEQIGTEATNCLTVRSISCGSSGGGNEYSITLGKYWTNRNIFLIDTNFTISNINRYEILSYISRSSIIRATLSLGLNGEMVERPRRLIAKWTWKIDEFRIRRTCKTNL